MIDALNAIEVITLFVADIDAARKFYARVFGRKVVYEDAVSTVIDLGNVMVNLLARQQAPTLVEPKSVAGPGAGSRALFTIKVADVDAVCRMLGEHGVAILNGPIDRPWGRRTAAFADPDGNVWEVAQELPKR